jgi:hypothetical protein
MHMQSHRTRLLISAALVATFHLVPVAAADYCVSTTAELRTAVSTAATSAEDDVIKLVRGGYPLNSALQGTFNGSIVLRGGYAAGCPLLSLRSLDASQTRIFGSPVQGSLVNLRVGEDLEIDGLSFEDLSGVQILDEGGAAAADGEVLIRRSRFLGNEFGLNVNSRSKNVRIENNLFVDNTSLCCGSETLNVGLAVRHTSVNSPQISVDVLFNTVLGSPKGIVLQGGGVFTGTPLLQNNILRASVVGSGAFALKLDDIDVSATNNVWGVVTTEDGGGFVANVLNVDANPQLDAGFVPIAGSPALNSGTDFVSGGIPSTDYDGGPRQIGSQPDRGALESAISDIGVITVTSTANSGAGTLRQAILDSNLTTNAEVIRFNLGAAGGCPYEIEPTSLLPAITSPLTIDGWSQPGSSPNTESSSDDSTRCVRLLGNLTRGLRLQPPQDRQITVRGIAFFSFDTAIDVDGDGSAVIEGNSFGTGGNLAASFEENAILVSGADGTRIGGDDDAQRNLITRAEGAGVRLLGGTGRIVRNNFIGIVRNGYGIARNGVGIHVSDGSGDLIEDNDIGHNDAQGILVDGAASEAISIRSNSIGRSPTPNPNPDIGRDAGNGANGIRITTGIGHEIASNRVSFNGTDGIVVLTDAIARLSANRIHENVQLGIDLSPNGVDDQSSDLDPAGRGNRGQNYPEISGAIGSNSDGVISGILPSSTGEFRIEFFVSDDCDGSENGEGEYLIGTTDVMIGGVTVPLPGGGSVILPIDSSVSFSAPVTGAFGVPALVGRYVTATATRLDSGATSEFSSCVLYEQGPQVFGDGFEEEL